MFNNGIIRVLMLIAQMVIGNVVDTYRPVITDSIGTVGYRMIFVVFIITVIYALGVFDKDKKENC